MNRFVAALEQLSQPNALFSDWVTDSTAKFKKDKPDREKIGEPCHTSSVQNSSYLRPECLRRKILL